MPRAYKTKSAKKHKSARTGRDKSGSEQVTATVGHKKRIKKAQSKKPKTNKNRQMKIRDLQRAEKLEKSIKSSQHLVPSMKSRIDELVKRQVGVKIILLIPFNDFADVKLLQSQIEGYILSKTQQPQGAEQSGEMEYRFPYFHFFAHPKQFPGLVKENFLFLTANRNIQKMLDFAKVADIIVPVLSCKGTNVESMTLNPHDSAKAFDNLGYLQLSALRHQGLPNSVCVLQHLDQVSQKPQKVSKLFQRFFHAQFQADDKMVVVNNSQDIFPLLRKLQSTPQTKMPWRDMRGYLIADKIKFDPKTGLTIVEGFLKGSAVNASQLVHITGIDDFQVESIEILKSRSKLERRKSVKNTGGMELEQGGNEQLIQHSIPNDEIKPLKDVPAGGEDLIDAFEGLALSKPLLQQQEEMKDELIEGQEDQDSFDESISQGDREEEKKKRVTMEARDQEDLEFEDEVEYPADTCVRELFRQYQGLSSFRNSSVNALENLPKEYNSVYAFRNYQHTLRSAARDAKEKAFAYPGFYIRIAIKGMALSVLETYNKQLPFVVSFLLRHERKMTQLHLRVRRNAGYPNDDVPVVSGNPYQIHVGFRKLTVKPIFSKIIGGVDKTKYRQHFTDSESYYYCTFYYYNTYTPSPATIYRLNQFTNAPQQVPIMSGDLSKCDPMHVVMKRIILTGYPYKTNRRRAVVRYMFFDPKDIKYFRPVQLKTKLGLRGNIEESLGTHGLMKCLFNDMIKPHDTVCLYLYKRVFPQAWF